MRVYSKINNIGRLSHIPFSLVTGNKLHLRRDNRFCSTMDALGDLLDDRGLSSHPIYAMLSPKSVAVVGASERVNSVGGDILMNLIQKPFGGVVYPVNVKRNQIHGIKAYKSVCDIPEHPVELVVITTPARTIPTIMRESVASGCKGFVVISSGFREIGADGEKLQLEIAKIARDANVPLVGPNCLGIISSVTGLNASFASSLPRAGKIALVSQSGAMIVGLIDWANSHHFGFSHIISTGAMAGLSWGDYLRFLGDDPHTESIVMYMESMGSAEAAREFILAAKEVSHFKPVVVIKVGRSPESALATVSHTGSLSGSDEVFEAAAKVAGVLRLPKMPMVFYMAECLSNQPLPKGTNLTIVTNAGGPAIVAVDALIESGGKLTPISDKVIQELNEVLPSNWSHNNPIDILGDAPPERFVDALRVLARSSSHSDGLLFILTPQSMTNPLRTAELLSKEIEEMDINIPVICCWLGGELVKEARALLDNRGIPTPIFPDVAAQLFTGIAIYAQQLGRYEIPMEVPRNALVNSYIQKCIDDMRAKSCKSRVLDEYTSKLILADAGLPVVPTERVESMDEAVKVAEKLGYPVVLKILSETLIHKAAVGGVFLNLHSSEELSAAFAKLVEISNEKDPEGFQAASLQKMYIPTPKSVELLLGSTSDPMLGPTLTVGHGGSLVEVIRDAAVTLPPLSNTQALDLLEETKIGKYLLSGKRALPEETVKELAQAIVDLGVTVCHNPEITEVEMNPIVLTEDNKLVGIDARIVVTDNNRNKNSVTSSGATSSITPFYHTSYVTSKNCSSNSVIVRPTRVEDGEILEQISDLYPTKMIDIPPKTRLKKLCCNDYLNNVNIIGYKGKLLSEEEIKNRNDMACNSIENSDDVLFILRIHFDRTKRSIRIRSFSKFNSNGIDEMKVEEEMENVIVSLVTETVRRIVQDKLAQSSNSELELFAWINEYATTQKQIFENLQMKKSPQDLQLRKNYTRMCCTVGPSW